eukprot:TRINITY_DN22163_c1_g1_i1.p1 TRINITY_DN22163_c1_g1~~TRINITY_DN22163_c1_g1_i1.p1  ORF type:complete len:224 (+),score=45.32 TRINITY_DN22163_c1_g1_i1:66-737(+)
MKINKRSRIVGSRCELVPYEREMVRTYHEWMQDPEILELTGSEPLSLEEEYENQLSWQDSEDKLTFIVLDRSRPGDSKQFGAAGVGGSLAGDVNVFFNDPEPEVDEETGDAKIATDIYAAGEIEVMIADKASRRKGIAREALRLLAGFCVQKLGTRRFVAKIKDHNAPSIALFESLGFQHLRRVEVFSEVIYDLNLDKISLPEPLPDVCVEQIPENLDEAVND